MSKQLHLVLNAIDTLMFRDGRPFNQADAGASEAVSVFPPYPPTLVGAVRAALWKQLGGQKKDWCEKKLGNGTNWQADDNRLGPLEFGAPLLLKDNSPVFPVPLHIVEGKHENGKKARTYLAPGPARESDRGQARFPVAKDGQLEGIKSIEDYWVAAEGMQKILSGDVPDEDDLIKRTDLWQTEPRVGVGIERISRTTSDGQLYMATHVRMRDDVALYVSLKGWQGKEFSKSLRPLAGEHRMAEISTGDAVSLPGSPEKFVDGKYCVVLLSPLVLDAMPEPGENNWQGLPGKLVSACLGKPVVIGGWSSTGGKPGPIPLRQCIPAGSVFFMQGDDGAALDRHGKHIGKSTEWGFGQILIGKWQENNQDGR